MASEILWGILFGIMASCTLNLGKALQKQGIKLFERQRMESVERARKGVIWTIGSVLSLIQPVFQITGQTILGAPATVYSAMMGTGIVVVLVYSWKVLKEPVSRTEVLGSLLIIAGTTVFGIASIFVPIPPSRSLNVTGFVTALVVVGATFGVLAAISFKVRPFWGLIWGIIAGSCGGMDNVFKAMSRDTSGIDLGPFSGFGSPLFYISFGLGIGAFFLTQVAYAHGKAITVVPAYMAFYIVLPLVLETAFFGTFPDPWQLLGVATCIAGVVLSTRFHGEPPGCGRSPAPK